jgi:hypothetical protein
MQNLLILYNPYYQKNVIKEHLEILIEKDKVAFGKLKSRLKNISHPFENKLNQLIKNINEKNYLQLFLTDYSSIYVAKVIKITKTDLSDLAPEYYKKYEVEAWFLIDDMYEIIRNNFKAVRDKVLANFITPNYGNHTFTLYGNNYVYPLIVKQKREIDYFLEVKDKLYKNIFKTKEYIKLKNLFQEYIFGDLIYSLHPRSLDNLISAEMEYQNYKKDLVYDFNSVVVKFSKIIELEVYFFVRNIFKKIFNKIKHLQYNVQGIEFTMSDFFNHKPNLGTIKKLLRERDVKEAIFNNFKDKSFTYFVLQTLLKEITFFQQIRNESVHGKSAGLEEVKMLRNKLLGIGEKSFLVELLKTR